jgi:hypothetical protein
MDSDSNASSSLSQVDSNIFEDSDTVSLDYDADSANELQSRSSTPSRTVERTKNRTSPIWDYTPYNRNHVNIRNLVSYWQCGECEAQKKPSTYYKESGGTSAAYIHLEKHHRISLKKNATILKDLRQQDIRIAAARVLDDNNKRRKRDNGILDVKRLEYLYVKWITACGIAFRMVSVPQFRASASSCR